MNLRQIEVFRAVMLAGSVTDAARSLHVSQPGISRMLSHIELQLGLRLFERRKGRLLALTFARDGIAAPPSPGVLTRVEKNGTRTVLASAGLAAATGPAVRDRPAGAARLTGPPGS